MLLAVTLLLAQAGSPPPAGLEAWLRDLFWLAAGVAALSVIYKNLRADPSADQKYASKKDLERVETDYKERASKNAERIGKLETSLAERHTDNVCRLDAIGDQIGRVAEDVRHDVRQELTAADLKVEAKMADVSERFEKATSRFEDIIRSLGRLEGEAQARANQYPPAGGGNRRA